MDVHQTGVEMTAKQEEKDLVVGMGTRRTHFQPVICAAIAA